MVLKCLVNEKHYISKKWPQIAAILIASLCSFTAGQLYVWTSLGIPYLLSGKFPVDFTFEEVSYLAMASIITTIMFTPVFSCLVDRIGRKRLLIFSFFLYFTSWALLAFSESLLEFYVARFVQGAGDAILFTAAPSYIGEVTEPDVRGTWGNVFTINLYTGQFVINILGSYLNLKTASLICAIIPIIGIIAMPFLPESPYFLLMKGKSDEARNSLKRLRGMNDVDQELMKIKACIETQMSASGTWKDVFIIKTNRKALFIGIGLITTQMFSGITTFLVYNQYIFQLSNGGLSETTSSMLFSSILLVSCLIAPFTVDKLGHRLALTISTVGSAVTLTIESIYFYCSEYAHLDTADYNWVPIAGLLLYVLFYFNGLGLVPNLMLSELFSASIKGKALGVTLIASMFISAATTLPFQTLVGSYGLFAPFLIYTVCTISLILFIHYCVPETKGKSLEEIQQMLIHSSYPGAPTN